jgi:hypothetical protein
MSLDSLSQELLKLLTVAIPIKNPTAIKEFIEGNQVLLKSGAHKIIVDSGGGEIFKDARALDFLPLIYEGRICRLWEARQFGFDYAATPYILNLDADTILPLEYVLGALKLLNENKADAVAIDYETLQGHYAFGTSIWKAPTLRKLYDFPPPAVDKLISIGQGQWVTAFQNGFCECTYMWRRLISSAKILETLPFRAKHLKRNGGSNP